VGHTPEQRSEHALCGAMTKRGVKCRAFAGQGTEHLGVGRCKYHGGATSSHRKHAVELEAQQRMVKLGQPIPDARPHQVLLGLLSASAGHCAWLQHEVAELDDLGTDEARVILRLHDTERDRCARIALACSQAGVEEAAIRFEEAKAVMLVGAITEAAKLIGLNRDQVRVFGLALRKVLNEDEFTEEDRLQEAIDRLRAADRRRIELEAQRTAGLIPPSELVLDGDAA
jgi:hypothetical protein